MATVPGTDFEKPRGISRVEVRNGYAQVQVTGLAGSLAAERLSVLRAIAEAGIGIDFVKLTSAGIAFVVAEEDASRVDEALNSISVDFTIAHDRCIVLVYAVNVRDEEGLIAGIVRRVIASGVRIDHLGDMHDRILLVMDAADARAAVASFQDVGGVHP